MMLHLLHDTPHLVVYYDSVNEWLYADWRGRLDLATVQTGCLLLAQCCLARPYTRVLNSNCDVLGISGEVVPWLVREYLPYLGLSSIEYVAWVCPPHPLAKLLVGEAIRQLQAPTVVTFEDLADAYAWLHQVHPGPDPALPRADQQSHLSKLVAAFSAELAHHQQVARLAVAPVRVGVAAGTLGAGAR